MSSPERERWIIEQSILGYSPSDIIDILQSEGDLNAPETFSNAMGKLEEETGTSNTLIAWHISTRQMLYRKNVEISDYKAAHAILQDIAALSGVYDAAKQEEAVKRTTHHG